MEDERICKDCVHYIRNYMKKDTFYKPNGGYCTLRKRKFISPVDEGCNKWEQQENNRAEQLKSFKMLLGDMCDRLDQLIQILQDEQ